MKVQTTTLDVERSGATTDSHFVIKATSKAFDILSSSLYSDKIQAIVRELSCNAYDSHVAAGKADQPIEVFLPTLLDPTFYVQDYGTGLHDFDVRGYYAHEITHEKIAVDDELIRSPDLSEEDRALWKRVGGIYNTYFESTKMSSNDFIGQLGLGSKSPFSYTSTFLVESVFNGVKSIYTCYKDEHNMPAIVRMSYEDTDDQNGVKVTIGVRTIDVDKFHVAARRALMYFAPKPIIKGASHVMPYQVSYLVEGSNWKVRAPGSTLQGAHVVQGFVAYPIDKAQILQHQQFSTVAEHLLGAHVDLYVDIGLVEVAASREALSYDKRTINNVIAAVEHAADEMRATFQSSFDKCTTQWEMLSQHHKLTSGDGTMSSIYHVLNNKDPFTWKGSPINGDFTYNPHKMSILQVVRAEHKLSGKKRGTRRLSTEVMWTSKVVSTAIDTTEAPRAMPLTLAMRYTQGMVVMVDDVTVSDTKRNRLIKQAMIEADTVAAHVLTFSADVTDPASTIKQALGDVPVVRLSSVRLEPSRSYGGSRSRSPQSKEAYVFSSFPELPATWFNRNRGPKRVFSHLTWDREQIDPSEGGIYVLRTAYRASTNFSGAQINHIDDVIATATKLGILKEGTRVIGLKHQDLEAYRKSGYQWDELYEYVGKRFDKLSSSHLSIGPALHAVHKRSNNLYLRFIAQWPELKDKIANGRFKQFVQQLVDMSAASQSLDSDEIANFARYLGSAATATQETINERVDQACRQSDITLGQYPMLSLIALRDDAEFMAFVIGYINLVEGKGCTPLQKPV